MAFSKAEEGVVERLLEQALHRVEDGWAYKSGWTDEKIAAAAKKTWPSGTFAKWKVRRYRFNKYGEATKKSGWKITHRQMKTIRAELQKQLVLLGPNRIEWREGFVMDSFVNMLAHKYNIKTTSFRINHYRDTAFGPVENPVIGPGAVSRPAASYRQRSMDKIVHPPERKRVKRKPVSPAKTVIAPSTMATIKEALAAPVQPKPEDITVPVPPPPAKEEQPLVTFQRQKLIDALDAIAKQEASMSGATKDLAHAITQHAQVNATMTVAIRRLAEDLAGLTKAISGIRL